jgi:hypothetical protein
VLAERPLNAGFWRCFDSTVDALAPLLAVAPMKNHPSRRHFEERTARKDTAIRPIHETGALCSSVGVCVTEMNMRRAPSRAPSFLGQLK